MENHRSILADFAVVAEIVGLGIQQEVGDVHRDHQKQLTLAPIHPAISAAQQQDQRRQHVEQRREENAQVLDVGGRQPREQQHQRRQEMAVACS